jgi:hypothetical protein
MNARTQLEALAAKLHEEHTHAFNAWKAVQGKTPFYYVLKGRTDALFQAVCMVNCALEDLDLEEQGEAQDTAQDDAYADLRRAGWY